MTNLFNSFRVKLLLVLATLLIATLSVQYTINYLNARRAARLISEQEQALAAGVALALENFSLTERLQDTYRRQEQALTQQQAGRLLNVLIVLENGDIDDSLNPNYIPRTLEDGTDRYVNIKDVNLPPLVDAGTATREVAALLNRSNTPPPQPGAPRAFPIQAQTNKGKNYIVVVLGSTDPNATTLEQVTALLPALVVLLVATFVTALLVWRFTRPITDLAEGVRRAAEGDFSYRVPARQRDEMGLLAAGFNRMNEEVGYMRELEMQVQQTERSAVVGRLASAIAHEIRNPLNYINLTLDHLRTSLAPEDAARRQTFMRLAENLKTEVARINTRISEFLKYTRPSQLNLQTLDLHLAVEDALRIVEAQAAENHIQTIIETHSRVPLISADAEALRSVLTNLMINAVHAMEANKQGRLTVRLLHNARFARIEISDTGQGISPENLSQIFEPYFSTKETGTGLGLAIVKKAIEDHRGTITVKSTLGLGTTFTIDLPLKTEPKNQNPTS